MTDTRPFNQEFLDLVESYEVPLAYVDGHARIDTDTLKAINPDNLYPKDMRAENLGKLADIIAFVNKWYPHLYDQETWGATVTTGKPSQCGTACCLAGWAVTEQGFYPTIGDGLDYSNILTDFTLDHVSINRLQLKDAYDLTPRTKVYAISPIAGLTLGLERQEASILFDENWKAVNDDVPAALRLIASGSTPVYYEDEADYEG